MYHQQIVHHLEEEEELLRRKLKVVEIHLPLLHLMKKLKKLNHPTLTRLKNHKLNRQYNPKN